MASSPSSSPAQQPRAPPADHGFSADQPGAAPTPSRPPAVTHLSTPSYESPLRHHRRQPSTPRPVKETLNARSEYTNSEDDGTPIHRINQYIIQQEIGRGSFGAVHRAVDQFGNEYAVKEFSKARLRKRAQSSILRRPGPPRRAAGHLAGLNAPLHRRSASDVQGAEEGRNPLFLIREEIAIMKKLNHSNLAALYEVLDDPSEDSLYMVMEMCKKGVVMKLEVGDRADPYDAESCRCWFRDLVLGVEYLHAQGVVHRDIKPDNLLLTDDDVLKIVDFGVSEMFERASDMTTTKSAGSPAFLPPELCVSRHGAISGKAADIWSMGVTLYCLRHGKVPFEQAAVLDLYESIKNDPLELPGAHPGEPPDPHFHDLMLRILDKDPDRRIKMEELRVHPWVTKGGLDPLLSAEENTSDLVEPPTAEEVSRAITGNLSNLIVVMKAVRKFRSLLGRRRPHLADSLLGQAGRLVQPPLTLSPSSSMSVPAAPDLHHSSHSDDSFDRRPAERAPAGGALRRPDAMDLDPPPHAPALRTNIEQPTPQAATFASPHPAHAPDVLQSPVALQSPVTFQSPEAAQGPDPFPGPRPGPRSPDHTGRGQAQDPLREFHYLHIGSGDEGPGAGDGPGADGPADGSDVVAVCESPPATDAQIYEQAYEESAARIRARSPAGSTLFLTRRVEHPHTYGRPAADAARDALDKLLGAGAQAKDAAAGGVLAAAERVRSRMDGGADD